MRDGGLKLRSTNRFPLGGYCGGGGFDFCRLKVCATSFLIALESNLWLQPTRTFPGLAMRLFPKCQRSPVEDRACLRLCASGAQYGFAVT
jgi:hypothetical protein